jgi:ArsR family transcriptional regulator
VRGTRTDVELYGMQAEIARVLAHPARLRILDRIGAGEVAYGALLDDLGVSKANLSQHLGILRQAGVVTVRRQGVHVHYRLMFPEIRELCSAMRELLARHLTANGRREKRLLRRVARAGGWA